MATTTMTLEAERWLDEVILHAIVADVTGADFAEIFLLPAGMGDVAIMSCHVIGFSLDVLTTTVAAGVLVSVRSNDGASRVDIVGSAPFVRFASTATSGGMAATVDPDALTLWRLNERLVVEGPELDTDATPTGDLRVIVKCVRVRPVEDQGVPIQLVR